jgi:geranylgeranyl pyrophosphate synthase
VTELADCALGLAQGEAMQMLQARDPRTTSEQYLERCALKTGRLFATACALGARFGGVPARALAAVRTYGHDLGLAFQIADDVLDVTATTDRLGKTAGRDVDLAKSTYPALLGVEGAKQRAESLVTEGCGALRAAGLLSTELDTLARFVVERES